MVATGGGVFGFILPIAKDKDAMNGPPAEDGGRPQIAAERRERYGRGWRYRGPSLGKDNGKNLQRQGLTRARTNNGKEGSCGAGLLHLPHREKQGRDGWGTRGVGRGWWL